MWTGKRWQGWVAIAVLAIAGVTTVACKGTVTLISEVPGLTVGIDGQWNFRGPENLCLEIKFRDSQGNQVGPLGRVTNGSGSGTVPPNAASWEARQVPCPDQAPAPSPGGPHDERTGSYLAEVLVAGGPIGFDRASPSHNALYEFIILCNPETNEASTIARSVIEAPLGAPIPGNVNVVFLAEAFQVSGSGRIVSFGQSPFLDFRADLNGKIGYADLSAGTNAVQTRVGPNLWIVATNVSYSDIKGYNRSNEIRIEQRLAGQSVPTIIQQTMIIRN